MSIQLHCRFNLLEPIKPQIVENKNLRVVFKTLNCVYFFKKYLSYLLTNQKQGKKKASIKTYTTVNIMGFI